MKRIALFLFLLPFGLFAQKEVTVNDMRLTYTLRNDSVDISLEAPTEGWVGVGFNSVNSIVGCDLLLFHVVNQETAVLDMFVKGVGNPKEDINLGGTMDVKILQGLESNGKTRVQFRLPFQSGDRYDFQHQLDQRFWLILAYSTHDDFSHHSRMRKHISFRFQD